MVAEPRYMTPRTPGRDTFGKDVIIIAKALGFDLMPWQQHWAMVVGEWEWTEIEGLAVPIRVPSYREAFDTTPRQSGKTLLKVAQQGARALMWKSWDERPQQLAYSAQSGSAARSKFRKEHVPMWRKSPIDKYIAKYRFSAEDSGIDFDNGASMTILSTSRSSGHGSTIDQAVLDEIFEDTDDRREQAVLPAMATRHDAQQLVSSTAGDDTSVIYNQKRAAGRAAVEAGKREGMAYLEFSMDDDADPENPKTWRQYHPALGHTISERTIQSALNQMKADPEEGIEGFKRAWGNIPQRRHVKHPTITRTQWTRLVDERAAPDGPVRFGADATPERTSATIVACDMNGVLEIVDHRPGADWVEDRLVDLLSAHRGSSAVVWGRGQLAVTPLRVDDVDAYTSLEYSDACSGFVDAVLAGTPKIVPVRNLYPMLEDAVLGGVRVFSGDLWKWGRVSDDADISPLVAASLAYHRAVIMNTQTDPLVMFA